MIAFAEREAARRRSSGRPRPERGEGWGEGVLLAALRTSYWATVRRFFRLPLTVGSSARFPRMTGGLAASRVGTSPSEGPIPEAAGPACPSSRGVGAGLAGTVLIRSNPRVRDEFDPIKGNRSGCTSRSRRGVRLPRVGSSVSRDSSHTGLPTGSIAQTRTGVRIP